MKKGIHPENYRPVAPLTRSILVRASSLTPQVVSISS